MDTHPVSRWLERRARLEAQERALGAVLDDVDEDLPRPDPRRLPGDAAALRGIPVVGRGGMGGAIRGTRPGDNLRD